MSKSENDSDGGKGRLSRFIKNRIGGVGSKGGGGNGARKVWVGVSDTHGGHKLGLMNPDVELYDEDENGVLIPYTPRMTAVQEYLWEQYTEDLDAVADIAGGDEILFCHGGDACHGYKYAQQLVSTQKGAQVLIAVSNMEPVLALSGLSTVRLVQGTAAHGFGEATAEVLISEQLKKQHLGIDIKTLRHGSATINDSVKIDYAHHGPGPGIREWTRGNVARYYLRSIMLSDIVAGRRPPDVVLRWHYHAQVFETVRVGEYESHIIVGPSYCGLSEHGQQATRSTPRVSNGLIALVIDGDKLADIHTVWRSKDLRTEESF